jgi:MFS family permease
MRVFQGLGSAATETASYAIAATLFPDNVTYVLGILEVANGLGYVIGPPLGGILYNISPMLPFLVVGLLPVPVLCALFHLLPRTLGESSEPSDWGKLRACLSRRGVVLVCAASVLGEGSFAFVEPVLEVYLQPLTSASAFVKRIGGHHGGVGLIYMVVSVTYTLVVPAVGLLSRRSSLGTRYVMVLGLVSITFGYLLLAPSPLLAWALPKPSLAGVAFGMAFLGVGQSAALVPNMACLLEVCEDMPDSEATTNVLAGILNAAYSLGSMTAPIASSTLGVHLPFRWSTTIWAVLVGAMACALTFAWGEHGSTRGDGEGWAVRLVRAAGGFALALGLGDSSKAEKDGRMPSRRMRRGAQLIFLAIVAGVVTAVYFGELSMIQSLHAGGVLPPGTILSSSDTAVYFNAAEDMKLQTDSDELAAAALDAAAEAVAAAAAHGSDGFAVRAAQMLLRRTS